MIRHGSGNRHRAGGRRHDAADTLRDVTVGGRVDAGPCRSASRGAATTSVALGEDAALDRLASEARWRPRATPPAGSIGYTGSYREPSADVVEVSVISVLEARGPD